MKNRRDMRPFDLSYVILCQTLTELWARRYAALFIKRDDEHTVHGRVDHILSHSLSIARLEENKICAFSVS